MPPREWLREKEREAPAAGEVKLPSLPTTTTTGRAKSEAPTPYLIRAVIVHLVSKFLILHIS